MRRYVIVCQGINCRREGSPELLVQLQQALSQDVSVEVSRYLCFGACAVASNVVVMPERLWYSFAMLATVEDMVAAIRRGEELPGLANHVRPDVREAVFGALAARLTPAPDTELA